MRSIAARTSAGFGALPVEEVGLGRPAGATRVAAIRGMNERDDRIDVGDGRAAKSECGHDAARIRDVVGASPRGGIARLGAARHVGTRRYAGSMGMRYPGADVAADGALLDAAQRRQAPSRHGEVRGAARPSEWARRLERQLDRGRRRRRGDGSLAARLCARRRRRRALGGDRGPARVLPAHQAAAQRAPRQRRRRLAARRAPSARSTSRRRRDNVGRARADGAARATS